MRELTSTNRPFGLTIKFTLRITESNSAQAFDLPDAIQL